MGAPHLQALADAVAASRGKLRLSQRELANKADMSLEAIQAIEGAKRKTFRPTTKAAIEEALDWETGDFEHVLEHGALPERRPRPRLRGPAGLTPTRERIATMSRDEVLAVADLIREATGSMEQAVAFIDGAERVRSAAQQREHSETG